jgi:hypothetical protein
MLPITKQQYNMYWWIWQLMLGKLAYEEPEPYVPGTVKADLVGLSRATLDLNYIAVRAPYLLPLDHIFTY